MSKNWLKWLGGIAVTAFANCIAGHIVGCLFERAGLPCPRDGMA
jgi:hypothetical protein